MIEIPTLETERLRMRAPRLDDLDAYAAFRGSDRAVHLGGPYSRAQAFDQLGELLGHWQLRGFGRWMVADKSSDAPFGVVGLFHPDDWPEPEIGWSVFGDAEGKGIAYEAALASRAYAYDVMGWDRVVSMIAPDNTRSQALARRMGCVQEADYQHPEIGPLQTWKHAKPEVGT